MRETPTSAQTPQSFTTDELAARWKVAAKTVRERILREELPAFRVGNRWRINHDVVIAYERRGLRQ